MIKVVKKGIVLPFLLLLATTALILGAFFVLDNKPKTTSQSNSASPKTLPTSTPPTSQQNLDNNITYSIPKGWKKEIDELGNISLTSPDFETNIELYGVVSQGAMLQIIKQLNDPEKSSRDQAIDIAQSYSLGFPASSKLDEIKIDNKEGFRYFDGHEQSNEIINIFDDKYVWTFLFACKDCYSKEEVDASEYAPIRDNFLASVKFTDQPNEGKFCGGIAGIACPSGYGCLLDGNYPDAGGKCVKE